MTDKFSKIEWCCIQKQGIKLIEPNEILGKSYLDSADSDLKVIKSPALKVQNDAAYNACYNSFYSILQKIGIKCEIHEGTFEFFSLVPGFSEEQINLIHTLLKNKEDIEQHLQKPKKIDPQPIEDFVLTCKQVFASLSYNQIRNIRKEISSTIKGIKKKR